MIRTCLALVILWLGGGFLVGCETGWKASREALDHVYQVEEFRLFYTLKGENALPAKHLADLNGNSTPDFIENIAIQLQVTTGLLVNSLGFVHPLESQRYKDKVKSIDVHFVKRKKGKGSTGDGVIVYNYKNRKVKRQPAVTLTLSNELKTDTLTPSHEMFHVFMNGYTMFKNRWVTEGLARWSEYLLRVGTGKHKELPGDSESLTTVLGQTYKTSTFWNRLAFLCDTRQGEFDSSGVKEFYIGHDRAVVGDNRLYGYDFVREYLHSLSRADKTAAADFGYKPEHWKEADQKSDRNNIYLLCTLESVLRQQGCTAKEPQEMEAFLLVITGYTKNRCRDILPR